MQYLESVIDSGLLNELKKSDYMDAFEQDFHGGPSD